MSQLTVIGKTYTCEVLVIGSGVSGYCAAIQAGRKGRSVILVEKDEVLGGNSGPNLGVGITGADRYNDYGTETGIVQDTEADVRPASRPLAMAELVGNLPLIERGCQETPRRHVDPRQRGRGRP